MKNDGSGAVGAPILVDVSTYENSAYVGIAQRNIVMDRTFRQSYRAVVANPNGPAVHSPWALLDVAC